MPQFLKGVQPSCEFQQFLCKLLRNTPAYKAQFALVQFLKVEGKKEELTDIGLATHTHTASLQYLFDLLNQLFGEICFLVICDSVLR